MFESVLKATSESSAISLRGFYCHAGNAYASTSPSEASSFLSSEVEAVNLAAKLALDFFAKAGQDLSNHPRFVLSVGSTPTAHAATAETRARLSSLLHGDLELHAGTVTYFMIFMVITHSANSFQEITHFSTCSNSTLA